MSKLPFIYITSIFLMNIFFLLICIFAGGDQYWIHINYEHSHLTWFSSIQLILIGCTCLSLGMMKFEDSINIRKVKDYILWIVLGAGFLFLSLDEKFQIHERLREGFFKPNKIGTNIPGVGAGDFLHLIFAAIGIMISIKVIKELKPFKVSLILYLFAIFISLYTVISDAGSDIPNAHSSITYIENFRFHQFLEELLETFAEAFFLMSFSFYRRIKLNQRMQR